MKVAVLHGKGDLRLDDAQRPIAGPNDLVIKVLAAGICGTDIHWNALGPRYQDRPMPLGHEYAGEVIEIGKNVRKFKIGDRVAYNSNNSPSDMGRGGECGGFAEYVILRDVDQQTQSLCPVPDNVSLEHAALVEPLSVATHGVNRADPQPGESVTIFGVGPIGLGVVAALKMRGIDDIIAFDLSPLRRERALALGARAVFDPRDKAPAEVLKEERGVGLVWGSEYPKTDIYFEISGANGLLREITDFANKRSRIIVIAMQRELVTFNASAMMSKETSLIGAQGYPTEFPEVMERLSDRTVDPEAMVTHRFPFAKFDEAFEIASDPNVAGKVLLTFD